MTKHEHTRLENLRAKKKALQLTSTEEKILSRLEMLEAMDQKKRYSARMPRARGSGKAHE